MFRCDLGCNNIPIIDIGDPEKTCAEDQSIAMRLLRLPVQVAARTVELLVDAIAQTRYGNRTLPLHPKSGTDSASKRQLQATDRAYAYLATQQETSSDASFREMDD